MDSRWKGCNSITVVQRRLLVIVCWCYLIPSITLAANESCYVYGDGEESISDCDPSIYTVGDTAILRCENLLLDSVSESSVEWHRDGDTFANGISTLTIADLAVVDSGDYSCVVNGRVLSTQTVEVKNTTSWDLPTPVCFTRLKGVFNCSWGELRDGIPDGASRDAVGGTSDIVPTRYQWHFEPDYGVHRLEIYPIAPDDVFSVVQVNITQMRYFVSVCAVNCLGHFHSEHVIVLYMDDVKLYPPTNIQLSPISVGQMRVSLDTPATWSELEVCYTYKVIQERTGLSTWQKAEKKLQEEHSFILLVHADRPYSRVCMMVAARLCNQQLFETLQYSPQVCSYTNMTEPSSGPPSFTFTDEQQDLDHPEIRTVTLTWQPLGPDTANGIITNYVVELSSNDSQCSTSDEEHYIPANETIYSFNGLSQYCQYRAELYAENKIGRSPASVITVIGAPHPVNVKTPLLAALILLSVVGISMVTVRLFLFIKERVLPKVPEPSHKHQLWNFKISHPVNHTEEEIFDQLPRLERGISVNTQTSEESDGFYQEPRGTRALLSNHGNSLAVKEHYMTMRVPSSTKQLTTINKTSLRTFNEGDGAAAHLSRNQSLHPSNRHQSEMRKIPEDSVFYVLPQPSNFSHYESNGKRDEHEPLLTNIPQDPYVTETGSLLGAGKGADDPRNIRSNIIAESRNGDQAEGIPYVLLPTLSDGKDILLDTYLGECDTYIKMQGDRTTLTAGVSGSPRGSNLQSSVSSSVGYVSEMQGDGTTPTAGVSDSPWGSNLQSNVSSSGGYVSEMQGDGTTPIAGVSDSPRGSNLQSVSSSGDYVSEMQGDGTTPIAGVSDSPRGSNLQSVSSSGDYVSENSIKLLKETKRGLSAVDVATSNIYVQEKSLLGSEVRHAQNGQRNREDADIKTQTCTTDDPYLDEELAKVGIRGATSPVVSMVSNAQTFDPYIQI